MGKLLAVDIGTQSLKISVYGSDFECLERYKEPYQSYAHSGNCVEIDAEVFWKAFVNLCARVVCKDLVGIVFSTLCPSLLLMDADGDPLSPVILHLDRRSGEQSARLVEMIGAERFRGITGNLPIPGGISVTSMLWIRDQWGGPLPQGAVFGHVVTFFMKRLTGSFFIDPSNASFTGLYETLKYSDWSPEIMEATGIGVERLPKVLDSLSVAGALLPKVAAATGLTQGLPVVIGANDTTCAVAGAGIREPGMLLNTSGTVELLVLCTDTPSVGSNHLLRTHAYRDRWLMMRTLGAGGASVEWFRSNFCRDLTRDEFYRGYMPDVLAKGGERTVRFAPYLTGDRHKLEPLKASFSDISLSSSRDDFLYALVADNINFMFSVLPEWEAGSKMEKRIFHVGGGAGDDYNDLKKRMLPDYEFVSIGETAERGAAMLGFEALGAR
ncbi:MAG: FGGY family carbohydrate kinase [Treponemataceae bacterium]